MSKRIFTALCTIAALYCIAGCDSCSQSGLSVVGGDPVDYQCGNGDLIVAKYYTLSDSSLYFVKVQLPDNEVYTLPQSVSGSGARYTDEMKMIWWVKGDSVTVQMRDEYGDWQPVFENCCVVGD
jgi:membrane-bound inhibitor of C-type lysozyme